MDDRILINFKEYVRELNDADATIDKQIFDILSQNEGPVDEGTIQRSLDLTRLIDEAVSRLESASLVTRDINGISLITEDSIGEPYELRRTSSNEIDFDPRFSSEDRKERRWKDEQDYQQQSQTQSSANDDLDIDSIFDDALGESIEEFVSDFSDLVFEETQAEDGVIEPLVNILKEMGYMEENQPVETSDEYSLLALIIQNFPISTEDIESELNMDSLSLMLSNLQADDLIVQTNDYRYTITTRLYKSLKDHIKSSKSAGKGNEDVELFKKYITSPENQFIDACFFLGYVHKKGLNLQKYNEIPEFEVLNLVRANSPISGDEVKSMVTNTLPVVVSRMLSKLTADGLIELNNNDQYRTTARLMFLMAKDTMSQALMAEEMQDYRSKYENK